MSSLDNRTSSSQVVHNQSPNIPTQQEAELILRTIELLVIIQLQAIEITQQLTDHTRLISAVRDTLRLINGIYNEEDSEEEESQ